MRLRVQKWGNSLALRIPKPFAEEVRIKPGSVVDLCLSDGRLVISPAGGTRITLAQLLAKITRKNLYREVEFGPAVGREVW